MNDQPRVYPHRANVDGTFDAICPDCFKTVSSERHEALLGQSERNHVCDPADIEDVWRAKPFFIHQ